MDFLGDDCCPPLREAPPQRSARAHKLLRTRARKALLKLTERDLLALCDFAGLVLEGKKNMLAEKILVSLDR